MAEVPQDHRLQLQLPRDIRPGPVHMAIIFESDPSARATGDDIKPLLGIMPDVDDDADFFRPRDLVTGNQWSVERKSARVLSLFTA